MAHPSPALSDWTASSASPMLPEKYNYPHTVYTSIPNAQHEYAPYDAPSQHLLSANATNARLTRIKRIQRYNNIFGYLLGIFSVTNTALMEAAMVYVLYKYYTTKDIPAPGRTSPWATGTQLWPTFVLLIASLLTLVMDLGGFIALLCCRSKRGEKVEASFNYTNYAIFVAKWVAVLILYRIGKTSKDLWGWSCDDRADQIQQFYATKLNFQQLCVEQTVAWGLTFAEVALKIILLIAALLLARKAKKLDRTG